MSLTDVAPDEVAGRAGLHHRHGSGALTAGFRALFAAVSGLLLTSGVGVVLWAITPSSVGGPQQSLRAGVTAFAAGNAMTVTIGRAALTLPPLMLTIVAVGLLAGVSGRGRTVPDDRTGELTSTAAAAAVYAAAVTVAGVVLGTPGAVAAEQWWRPFLLALAVVGTAVFLRGEAWRAVVVSRTPRWFPVAVRLGTAAAAGVVAAGALAFVLGLAGSFGNAGTVQTLAAPGPAAGFGMVLLGIAYLPNAVLAGAGYVTGVGFHIGSASYSPFGSSPVELPAVSLLAAAPDGRVASRVGMVLLLVPVVVALLVGRAAVRRLDSRSDRLSAVCAGAVWAGLLVGVLAALAGGGVSGGQWASTGAPPLLLGVVTALIVGVFGAIVAALARQTVAPTSAEATPGSDVVVGAAAGIAADAADHPDAESDDPVGPTADHDASGTDAELDTAGNAELDTGGNADLASAAGVGLDEAGAAVDDDEVAVERDGSGEAVAESAADAGELDLGGASVATRALDADKAGPLPAADLADDPVAAESAAATQPDASVATAATGAGTVPLARREDDVLDSGPSEPVRSGAEPRHVG